MTSKKTLLQKYFTWYYLFNFEFTFESVDHRPECRDTYGTFLRSRAPNLKSFLVFLLTKEPKYKENGEKWETRSTFYSITKRLSAFISG